MKSSPSIPRKHWTQVEAALELCPICGDRVRLVQSDGSDCRISRECRRWFYLRCLNCNLLFGYEPDRGGMYDAASLPDMVQEWNKSTARPVRVLPRLISLAAARVNAGMKQKDVAEILGVTRSHYSNVEHGRYPVKAQDLKILARLFGVRICELEVPRLVDGREKKKC